MSVHTPKTHRRYMHYRKKNDMIVIKYGAEWCGPCKQIAPIFKELAVKYKNVYFLDIDVDTEKSPNQDQSMIDHDDFSNIRSIPHFKIFVNKELKHEFKGADETNLCESVKKYSTLVKQKDKKSSKSKTPSDKTKKKNKSKTPSDKTKKKNKSKTPSNKSKTKTKKKTKIPSNKTKKKTKTSSNKTKKKTKIPSDKTKKNTNK